MMRSLTSRVCWLVVLLALTGSLRALEIQQILWGFDGKLAADCFNPISVLVSNPGGNTFDGPVALSQVYANDPSESEDIQQVFLAPHTARWVQFHFWFRSNPTRYMLRWGRGSNERFEIETTPEADVPARVWLRDAENPLASSSALKSFPDQLFPTSVVATEGLDAVVLDHVPSWEPARREAFLDWLRRGGTLHLISTAAGGYPAFGQGLEVLNVTQDETRLGSGRILRHEIAAGEMTTQYLSEHGSRPRDIIKVQNPAIYDLDSTLFRMLSSITRPVVLWSFIHLLTIAYVVVIGPIHYYFRQRLDYRVSIAAFLGAVAVFSLAFSSVGRRGYGESQKVYSLSLARSLGGGRSDVTQWISAFVTHGDLYTLSHTAPANFYSTAGNPEETASHIFNGKEGHIVSDIPLFSARTFLHRGVMNGDDPSVTVEQWEEDNGKLRSLRLRPGAGFPKSFIKAQARWGSSIYTLTMKNGALEISGVEELSTAFDRNVLTRLNYGMIQTGKTGDLSPHLKLIPLLGAWAVQAPEIFPTTLSSPPGQASRLQLLVTAPAPASFNVQGPGFNQESGVVLYVKDVFKP